MNPGATNNGESEPMGQDTWNSESARKMAELGWLEDGPKLWVSTSGGLRLSDIDQSFAGSVHIEVTPRLRISVDRLAPDSLTGLEISVPPKELDAGEWSAVEYIAGAELVRFISMEGEGLLPFELPSLPLPLQQFAVAASLAELVHPVFALEARRLLPEDAAVAVAARKLAASSTPFVDALGEAVENRPDQTANGGSEGEEFRSLLAMLANGDQALDAPSWDEPRTGRDRLIDAAVIRQLSGLPPLNASTDTGAAAGARAGGSWVPDYDLIEVDHVLSATIEPVGQELTVSVVSEDTSEAVFASTVDRSGRLATISVNFEGGAQVGSALLPTPDTDFWVEVHGPEEPATERFERAADFAEAAAARLVAVLQAIGAGQAAIGGVATFVAELRTLADVYENVAYDHERAGQTRHFAAQLGRGESPFEHMPELRTSDLLISAQPVLDSYLQFRTSPPRFHQDELRRSLLARPSATLSGDEIPDFVPIDWIVEEFARSMSATPLPDRALARSMNSGDDTSHRVELDDEQYETTGISSIVIEFSAHTVTVTVTRDRGRANYALRVVEAGESLPMEHSENPIADVYVAEFRGVPGTLRVEFDLGPQQ